MKLFSWMHRKSKTDIASSFKGSATGLKSSFDSQGVYATPNNNYSTLKWQPQNNHYFNDFSAENYEESNTRENDEINDEIFPGFLTIGTLSVETVTDPPTPTFGFTSQDINEEATTNIKHDLNLLSEDLEKFLKAEGEMQRTNKLSCDKVEPNTITLSDEVKEDMCPLQGYLLGSSTEQCGPGEIDDKGKTSLHCLFKRRLMMKRKTIGEDEDSGKKAAKENKSAYHLTKKVLQKPPIFCSDVSVGCAVKPPRKATKPNKIKSLFHKKVHPEISKAAEEDNGFSNYENERIIDKSKSGIRKSNKIGCWTSLTNGKKRLSKHDVISPADGTKMHSDLPTKEMAGCSSTEHWINTDDEFFVLELQENKGNRV
ncbi:hypothetical protein RND81_11G190600 [Saponaria officinalis]|uniref:Protein LAZY 1-like n=1 Tax=Saponaria officinalis TaxID=3572 RepID=A0AAW1HQM6_SAPOF